jgi:hypothetical protein
MKLGIALVIAGVAFGAASLARSQNFDFGDANQEGIVESVREVVIPRDMHSFDPEVLEHAVRPASAEEAVIRLDGGELITIHQNSGLRRGERVRVVLTGSQAHVERLDP